jgi:hypothetical protein
VGESSFPRRQFFFSRFEGFFPSASIIFLGGRECFSPSASIIILGWRECF